MRSIIFALAALAMAVLNSGCATSNGSGLLGNGLAVPGGLAQGCGCGGGCGDSCGGGCGLRGRSSGLLGKLGNRRNTSVGLGLFERGASCTSCGTQGVQVDHGGSCTSCGNFAAVGQGGVLSRFGEGGVASRAGGRLCGLASCGVSSGGCGGGCGLAHAAQAFAGAAGGAGGGGCSLCGTGKCLCDAIHSIPGRLHAINQPYGGQIPHTNPNAGGQGGGAVPQVAYPYYTTRGPRDFLQDSCEKTPIVPYSPRTTCLPSIGW